MGFIGSRGTFLAFNFFLKKKNPFNHSSLSPSVWDAAAPWGVLGTAYVSVRRVIDDACLQGPPSQCIFAANWTVHGGRLLKIGGGLGLAGPKYLQDADAVRVSCKQGVVLPQYPVSSITHLKTPNPSHGNTESDPKQGNTEIQ
ncbi:hypothetical protein V8C34DRAFT_284350 [Trichoderma compactum]